MKWTGAAVGDAAVVLSAFLHDNAGLIQVTPPHDDAVHALAS